jgi:hypothetical protein
MSNEAERLSDELSAVDAALRQLQPTAAGLDRDRLMYLAGQASASANVPAKARPIYKNWWALSTATLLMLSLTLGGMLAARGPSQIVINVEGSDTAQAMLAVRNRPDSSSDNNANYLKMRNLVVSRGVDALPIEQPSQRSQTLPTLTPISRPSSLGG